LSDHYFVLGVNERLQNVRCVLVKGGFYPMTTPRPTVVEIPLRLPLCEPGTEKTDLEETFWRLMFSLQSLHDKEEYLDDLSDISKTLQKTLIKLFAVSFFELK